MSDKVQVTLKPIFADIQTAANLLSLSVSTVEALIRDADSNGFPHTRQLSSRRAGILLKELEAWAETRPLPSFLPVPNRGAEKPRNSNK